MRKAPDWGPLSLHVVCNDLREVSLERLTQNPVQIRLVDVIRHLGNRSLIRPVWRHVKGHDHSFTPPSIPQSLYNFCFFPLTLTTMRSPDQKAQYH